VKRRVGAEMVSGNMFEIGDFNPSSKLSHLQPLALLAENFPAHLQHSFKPFSAPLCIFPKSFDAGLFDLRLDLLPPTTERHDLGFLLEVGLSCRVGG